MPTETLSPLPKLQFFDNNGKPLAGGKLFSYAAGTSTKLATYVDSTGVTLNANPIVLDFRGEANVWIPPNVPYKYVLAPANATDPPTNPTWTVDQIVNSQLLTLFAGVDTGSTNDYVVNYNAPYTSYEDGIVIYFVPANTNTGASTLNVNGLGPIAITDPIGAALTAGQIVAGQIAAVAYLGGTFTLLSSSAILLSGTFVGTLTGCSGTVTNSVSYVRSGNIVVLRFPTGLLGTSNAVTMTMTGLPAALQPAVSQVYLTRAVDNNIAVLATVGISGGTLTFGEGVDGDVNGFTNTSTKGLPFNWSLIYAI